MRCIAEVRSPYESYGRRCNNAATAGNYCKTHDPVARKAREKTAAKAGREWAEKAIAYGAKHTRRK